MVIDFPQNAVGLRNLEVATIPWTVNAAARVGAADASAGARLAHPILPNLVAAELPQTASAWRGSSGVHCPPESWSPDAVHLAVTTMPTSGAVANLRSLNGSVGARNPRLRQQPAPHVGAARRPV
jgi:hypothetical protein